MVDKKVWLLARKWLLTRKFRRHDANKTISTIRKTLKIVWNLHLLTCIYLTILSSPAIQSWITLIPLLMVATMATSLHVPGTEMTALSALFNSTRGDRWRWREEQEAGAVWNFTLDAAGDFVSNPCSSSVATNQTWQGVTCSHAPHVCSSQSCHITELSLVFYRLSGSIPSDIGNLLFLTVLHFDQNQLLGTIPPEVSNLAALTHLSVWINALTGSIPPVIGQLQALSYLDLDANKLTGTLPRELGNLTALDSLHIARTLITGTIPGTMGQLSALRKLNLRSNLLNGTIPSEIFQLIDLQELFLDRNQLTGTISSDIGNFTALVEIYLYGNQLTGTIPSEVGQLLAMEIFSVHTNSLNGTLPSEIAQMTTLQILALYDTLLTGTITSELSQLTNLKELYLDRNRLTGTIPHEMWQLFALEILSLYSNKLKGNISSAVGQMIALNRLYLHSNDLSGTIPSSVGQLTRLEILSLEYNELTGTIPSEVGYLTALEIFYLRGNQLTGTIPDTIGNLMTVQLFSLRYNQLKGTIPSDIGRMIALRIIELNNNQLTGSIPSTVGNLVNLSEMWLHDNALSGTFPAEMSKLKSLESLLLQNNVFTGHVQGAFNHSIQVALETVDISNNRLSGSLPAEIFLLPKLKVLSLSVNCFNEKLSQSLCSARQVEVLSLNGLGVAEGCASSVVMPLSGVGLFNKIGGSIPSCVWTLRNLSVLHLTGNGLSGELVQVLPANSQVVDVSLSHNELTGTIPVDIFNIANVDLSYNQFGGEYPGTAVYRPESNINLEINRLSGQLPVSELERVSNGSLSILRGNLFSCNSVPENDDFSRDYVCGSRNLNDSLLVFASVFGGAVLLMLLVVASVRFVSVKLQNRLVAAFHSRGVLLWAYLTYLKNLDPHSLKYSPAVRKVAMLSSSFVDIMQYTMKLLAGILAGSVVLIMVKVLDTYDVYATHSHTFAWFWTLAYMRGEVPAGLLLMLWVGAISVCFYIIVVYPIWSCGRIETPPKAVNKAAGKDIKSEIGHFKSHAVSAGLAFIFNACITIAVNTAYIYSTQQALGASINFFIQLSLSIFRLVYVAAAFPLLSRSIQSAVENVRFRFILLTINNLLIPCVVTALTSDACFQGLLVPADAISTPYSYSTCMVYAAVASTDVFCSAYGIVEVESASVVPPFTYSNQCGSVVLTSYIPIFLLGFSIQLLLPLILLASLRYVPYGSMTPSVRGMFYGVMFPEYWLQDGDVLVSSRAIVHNDPHVILDTRTIFCNDVLNNLLVMLTFGLCSPVLAVAVACSVLLKMSLWVLLLGRFTRFFLEDTEEDVAPPAAVGSISADLVEPTITCVPSRQSKISMSRYDGEIHFVLAALAEVFIPLFEVLAGSFWRLVWCSGLFVAVLGWDMATDEVGWLQSLWVPLIPLGYAILLRCGAHYCQYSSSSSSSSSRVAKQGAEELENEECRRHEALRVSQSPLHENYYENY